VPSRAVLVLAGLDPSGGAGLLADAEAIRETGAKPLCVPTALTVQTTNRARGFEPVARDYFVQATQALLEEEEIAAIKIGMIGSPEIAAAIAELLADPRCASLPVVLDPVIASTSGAPLFRGSIDDAHAAIRSLWTRAIVTPNALEAALLLALRDPPRDEAELGRAARTLLDQGAHAVVIKGGHALGDESIDLLIKRDALCANQLSEHRFAAPRLLARDSKARIVKRGTGCRFASALAANLALGNSLPASVLAAKSQVLRYLRSE
jgi:hydroxymethylpyrimidine/phosphomethylpyrimidine kinase